MTSIKLISEPDKNNPYAVIYKPKGLPSAPLSADDKENALCQAIELFPALSQVHGKKEIEHGLLHRLDTPTDGLILIAASQDFYDFMNIEQEQGRFIKYYTAVCNMNPENPKLLDGFPPAAFTPKEKLKIESYFRSFGKGGKEVRPVTKDSGMAALKKLGKPKLYQTEIFSINDSKNNHGEYLCKLVCRISQGYRHQVRCHLAWAGLPVVNDPIYNASFRCQEAGGTVPGQDASLPLQFSATRIEFTNPVENKLKIFNEVL